MTVPAGSGPTVRRILLGSQLRRLRERNDISREDAGYHIRASGSKISRLELGRVGFKERDVDGPARAYYRRDRRQAERAHVLALAHQGSERQRGWWQTLRRMWPPVLVPCPTSAWRRPPQLHPRPTRSQFVPGLLQTEEYARAVIVPGAPGVAPDEVERRARRRAG